MHCFSMHHTFDTNLAEAFTLHEQGNDCDTALKSPREAQRVLQSSPAVHVTCLVCMYLAVFVTSSSVSQAPQIMLGTLPYHGCVLLHPQNVDRQKGNFFSQAIPRWTESMHQHFCNVVYSALPSDDILVLLVCKDEQFLSDSYI